MAHVHEITIKIFISMNFLDQLKKIINVQNIEINNQKNITENETTIEISGTIPTLFYIAQDAARKGIPIIVN